MKLRHLFESSRKTAVAAFGRMNPPTIGHAKLVDKIKSIPGDHFLFLSQTQNAKDNPLSFDQKIRFAKASFNNITIGNPTVRTPIQMMQQLQELGYTDVVYIAGSDRVDSFEGLLNKYNGKDYKFNSIKVVSAGERDPDADGAEGMSASKMRRAAIEGDFDSFKQGVASPQIAKEMYDAIRDAMGVKDQEPVEEADVVMNKSSLIDYIRNMIVDYINSEEDLSKLANLLKQTVGKDVKIQGKRFRVTSEDVNEILGFVTKQPKRTTIKKKVQKQDDALGQKVQDKLAQYRKQAAKDGSRKT